MKQLSNKLFSLLAVVSLMFFVACNDNMGKPDTRLSKVEDLIEPADGKTVVLEASATASVYFEWEYVNPKESGMLAYQIAFDKSDGDFSNPLYTLPAENNGYKNFVNISHKLLNKISGMAGIGASETGTLKWTVFSAKGIQLAKASIDHSITVTRLAGFADVPVDVYVTGEASEGGTDLEQSHKMKAIAPGEFETYTALKAGDPFYFTDGISGTPREFYTDQGIVKENGTASVDQDGVYRINLDFNTGAASYSLVVSIGFYFSPANDILFDLPYVGNGVFQAIGQTVTFHEESWGRDERYKFRMFVKEDGGAADEKELEWATLNQTDSRPTASSPETYYYMELIENLTQWDNKWKLMGDFDDVPADYTIYLQADKPYTHTITK